MTASASLPKLWQILLLGVAACLAASALRWLAWYDGTRGRYGLLMLANLLRLGVVFLAYALVVGSVSLQPDESATRLGRSLFSISCSVLLFLVCAGFPLLWPVALVLPAVVLGILFFRQRDLLAGGIKPVLWRACLSIALFVVTWYQAASTTRSALLGLGERIDSTIGADRLLDWAKKEIESTPPGKWRTLPPDERPEDVIELMGVGGTWPLVRVTNAEERFVFLANGSGYGYGITIYPFDVEETENRGWIRWSPGIYLDTVSK
jgi:hypothetical protein